MCQAIPFLPLIPFLNYEGWQMTIPNCPQNQISSWHHVTSSLNKQFFGVVVGIFDNEVVNVR